jgi:hypothetical protein
MKLTMKELGWHPRRKTEEQLDAKELEKLETWLLSNVGVEVNGLILVRADDIDGRPAFRVMRAAPESKAVN